MVRIRFRRVGAKNQASFRIVAAEKESPRDGRFLEVLGHYNPRTEPPTIRVDEARLFHWLSHGAQPSDSVKRTLATIGTWERWESFKQGEPLETLLEQAQAAAPEVDPRTRRDDLIGQRTKKRRKKREEKAPPAPPEAAPVEAAEPEAPAAEAPPEAAPDEAAEPEAEPALAPDEPEAAAPEPAAEGAGDAEAEAAEQSAGETELEAEGIAEGAEAQDDSTAESAEGAA